MNMAIDLPYYPSSCSRASHAVSNALPESVMFVMQTDSGWENAINELRRIREYDEDFDGEGSFPPPIEIVDTAIRFSNRLKVSRFPAPHRILASVNQSIVFEWYFPYEYRQIEFASPHEAEFTVIPKDDSGIKFTKVTI